MSAPMFKLDFSGLVAPTMLNSLTTYVWVTGLI